MADDVIAMSLTCSGCGKTIFNDQASLRHPIDFLKACEDRGWLCAHQPVAQPPKCPDCKGKS